jgi:hypothetical protein
MKGKLKLKSKPSEVKFKSQTIKRKQIDNSDNAEQIRRFMCPPPEDFPLLKTHYPGEYFQRIDGNSVVQRWKDDAGVDHHIFMFYPTGDPEIFFKEAEKNWTTKNDYLLLLWKRLNKFGIAKYCDIPECITKDDFEKYLNQNPVKRLKLQVKPPVFQRLKLKVAPRLKLKVKK